MTSTFGLFVKYPEPGRVKTRLAKSLGDELAAELYEAFLSDLVTRFCDINARRVLAYTPDDERSRQFFERLASGQFKLWAQPDGPLGERMQNFFETFGPGPIVLIGSDSPTLLRCDVEHALAALSNDVDCVLGPATDGGVYLIGLHRQPYSLFDRVEWSTSSVFEQMIAEVQHAGASLELLPLWYDIDTLNDIHFLRGHLAALRMTQPQLWEEVAQTRRVLDVIAMVRHYNPYPANAAHTSPSTSRDS